MTGAVPKFATEPITGLPMDGGEVPTGRMHRPPPWYRECQEMRRLPYCEILSLDVRTGRAVANFEGALVVIQGKLTRTPAQIAPRRGGRDGGNEA